VLRAEPVAAPDAVDAASAHLDASGHDLVGRALGFASGAPSSGRESPAPPRR
jgi:hypothetical protein